MYIWNKCRPTVYYTADNSVPVSPGVGMVPRWIGTVAGRVDPQSFAEMTPLEFYQNITCNNEYWLFSARLRNKIDSLADLRL